MVGSSSHGPSFTFRRSDHRSLPVHIDLRRIEQYAGQERGGGESEDALPAACLDHERIRLVRAQLALAGGRVEEVEALLEGDFCTIREGETTLTDLWFELHISIAQRRAGREPSGAERDAVIAANPPPPRIDPHLQLHVGLGSWAAARV